jgi:lauroyl/myristoyl acyltransferase
MSAAARALQAALVAAGTMGRAAHRLYPTNPSPAEVGALFRDASVADAADIARAMAGARYQNRALVEVARRGGEGAIAQLVDPASVDRMRALGGGPAILVGWHLGPPFGVLGAIEAAGVRALVVRRAFASPRTPIVDVVLVDGGRQRGSAAFRASLAQLRGGGFVLLAADAPESSETAAVPCFGRPRPMARGAFALARATGAPLVPVAARMDRAGVIRIAVGAPLPRIGEGDALETALAAAAAAWLEAFVRESPGQLRRCVLAWLTEGSPIA